MRTEVIVHISKAELDEAKKDFYEWNPGEVWDEKNI